MVLFGSRPSPPDRSLPAQTPGGGDRDEERRPQARAPSTPPPAIAKGDLRVPSNLLAMLSRKVFCGANKPFITGMAAAPSAPLAALAGRVCLCVRACPYVCVEGGRS